MFISYQKNTRQSYIKKAYFKINASVKVLIGILIYAQKHNKNKYFQKKMKINLITDNLIYNTLVRLQNITSVSIL